MNTEKQSVISGGIKKSTLLLALAAIVVAASASPEVTKPLFVKYYRAVYQAEPVRAL